jgi:tetratricopeptide (TPR) repeat protein
MPDEQDPVTAPPTPFDDFLDRFLRGEKVDPAGFIAAHPELSERERRQVLTLGASGQEDADETEPAGADPLPVSRIAGYRLIRRLGAGASGAVYLAEDESLGRTIAVKVLGPDILGRGEHAERFAREARAVARLRHRNIVTIHAAGESLGVRYLAMEHVPGRGLDEVLDDAAAVGSRPRGADVLRWGADLARALECAHAEGIVHRDVKPSNVRIDSAGRAVLLDFGIARSDGAATLTMSGEFRGSPQYASPEQIGVAGAAVDARSDVYSLGVTLYELLTGVAPFRAPTREQLFHQILTREPVAPRRIEPSVPRDLETIVLAMLEKEPARRPPTAALVAEDLEAVAQGRPIVTRPPSRLGRLARWAKRERAKASLAALLALGIPVLAILWATIAANQATIAANKTKVAKAEAAEREARLAAMLSEGFLEYGEGSPAAAIGIFEAARRLDPASAEAQAGYALAKIATKDYDGAIAFLDREAADGSAPAWRAQLRARAVARGESGGRPESAPASRTSSAAAPIDHFVLGMLALDRVHAGDRKAPDVAYAHLLAAVLAAPAPSALYHYELGHAAWHAHRPAEARAVAQAIRERWPDTPESAFAIGRTLFEADREAAYAALVEAARSAPWSATAATFIVGKLADSSRPPLVELGVDFGRQAVARHPTHGAVRRNLAHALRVKGEIDDAIEEAREAVRIDPDNADSHFLLADLLMGKKDYASAVSLAREAARLRPGSPGASRLLGTAALEHGDLDEAVRALERSLTLDPDDPATLCHLGRAHARRGDFELAVEKLEAGDRIGSKNPRWKLPSKKWLADAREVLRQRSASTPAESRDVSR